MKFVERWRIKTSEKNIEKLKVNFIKNEELKI